MAVFDWCRTGKHEQCIGEFEKFIVGPRGKITYLDEWVRCQCRTRSCKCYIKPADREKPVRKNRKRKS